MGSLDVSLVGGWKPLYASFKSVLELDPRGHASWPCDSRWVKVIDCLRLSSCQGGCEEGLVKDGMDSGGGEAEGGIKKIAEGCGKIEKYVIFGGRGRL